jgi:hypothetical protein
LKYWFFAMAILFSVGLILTLNHYQNLLAPTTTSFTGETLTPKNYLSSELPTGSLLSPELTRFAVLSQNQLQIKEKNKTIFNHAFEMNIDQATWINEDSLLVGLSDGSKQELVSVNVSTQKIRSIKQFFLGKMAFQQIDFSHFTNDVYVLLQYDQDYQLYYFDTNNNSNRLQVSDYIIEKIAVAKTKHEWYFQNRKHEQPYLFVRSQENTSLVAENAKILFSNEDALYYGLLDDKGLVKEIKKYENGLSTTISPLSKPIEPEFIFMHNHVIYELQNKTLFQGDQLITQFSEQEKTRIINQQDLLINDGNGSKFYDFK